MLDFATGSDLYNSVSPVNGNPVVADVRFAASIFFLAINTPRESELGSNPW
jgi:hypothetical protein